MSEKFEDIFPNEIGETKEKKPLPVTGQELLAMVDSPKFRNLLRLAGKTTTTGREAGFGVTRKPYNSKEFVFSDLAEAEELSIELEELHDRMDEILSEGSGLMAVLVLHLHPGIAGTAPIVTSASVSGQGDLHAYNMYKFLGSSGSNVLSFPVGLIGQIDNEGSYEFLVFQEQFRENLDDMPGTAELMSAELDNVGSQEDVLRILRENNYKAEMIKINKRGKINPEDIPKLRNFAFQPELMEE